MTRMYRWQYHFNAVHNMFPEDAGSRHAHSFLVIFHIKIEKVDIDEQKQCEKELKGLLNRFNGKYLNEMRIFEGKIPTIEVICEVLFPYVRGIVKKHGLKLVQLEVGDGPTALCVVRETEGDGNIQWEDGLFFSPSL